MKVWLFVVALVIAGLSAGTVSAQKTKNASDDTPVITINRDPVRKFLEYVVKDKPDDIEVTKAANLRDLADQAGYDGHSPVNLRFVVPEKTTVVGKPGGGIGIDTGVWPENAIVTLIVKGNVYGGGGNGGNGGPMPMATAGSAGGDAIYVRSLVSIAIAKDGSVAARFAPGTTPDDPALVSAIEAELAK